MSRLIEAFAQFFTGEGSVLSSGWLKFLESGSNITLKAVYSDEGITALANPVQLDAEGRCPSIFGYGAYRVISYAYNPSDPGNPGDQIQVFDPVYPPLTEADASANSLGFATWSALTTYTEGNIVALGGVLYESLADSNLGNNPATETAYWSIIDFLDFWNSTVTYIADDLVAYSGKVYVSLVGSNLNNTPSSSPTYWRDLSIPEMPEDFSTVGRTLSDRNFTLWGLSSSATADSTFLLPSMTTSKDGFIAHFFNNSATYNLTVAPQGTAATYTGTNLVLPPYTSVALRYSGTLDLWMPLGHSFAHSFGIKNYNPAAAHSSANDLVVGDFTGYAGLSVGSISTGTGILAFADGVSPDDFKGGVAYNHATDQLLLRAADTYGLTIAGTYIESSLPIGINITPTDGYSVDADDLVVSSGGDNAGITIVSAATGTGNIAFADGTGSTEELAGLISYDHDSDLLTIGSSVSLAFAINSSQVAGIDQYGNVSIGDVDPTDYNADADNLVIYSTGNTGLTIVSGASGTGNIYFADGTGSSEAKAGVIYYSHDTDAFYMYVHDLVVATFSSPSNYGTFTIYGGTTGTYTARLLMNSGGVLSLAATSSGAIQGSLTYSISSEYWVMSVAGSTSRGIRVDNSAVAGDTALMVYDVDNGVLERVTVGAADSGGSGYKVLRIPN